MAEGNVEKKNVEYVSITALSKGRRMLVMLGDIFLTFMLAVFLFNLVIFPIFQAVSGFESKYSAQENYERERYDILYDNEILFYDLDSTTDKYDINESLTYTGKGFIRYYTFKNESDKKYEVFYRYYTQISHSVSDSNYWSEVFERMGNEDVDKFFSASFDSVSLKEEYVEEFKTIFDEQDEPSSQAVQDYNDVFNSVFLGLYAMMIDDIKIHDISSPNYELSYNEMQEELSKLSSYSDSLVYLCAYGSFALSFLILEVLYPFLNKKGRTLTMRIMKVETVSIDNYEHPRKLKLALVSFYRLIESLCLIMFVPLPMVSIGYVFALPQLSFLTIVSLMYVLIFVFFTIFNSFNRSISDYLSRTVVLTEESLNEVYRAKGYQL